MYRELFTHIPFDPESQAIFDDLCAHRPDELRFLVHLLQRDPLLHVTIPAILHAFEVLRARFAAGHTLFLCGNGGSAADCMHIAGELMKSFHLRRHLSAASKAEFDTIPLGPQLASQLEYGLPCIVLGFNQALNSAILNDSGLTDILFAQELYVVGKPGDVLLGISTSGNARNVLHAVAVAKTRGMVTLGLTGQAGGQLAAVVDLLLNVPETVTPYIQEQHEIVYHALCAMLEARFFGQAEAN